MEVSDRYKTDGVVIFNGVKLKPSQMVWQCETENCKTPPKIQRRGQYKDKHYCNACANKIKSLDKEMVARRNAAISKGLKNNPKLIESIKKNNANPLIKQKISNSLKEFYQNNPEKKEKYKIIALENNKKTGFGTSNFGKKIWSERSEEEKSQISKKVTKGLLEFGEEEHKKLIKKYHSRFKLISYSLDKENNPNNTYECEKKHQFIMRGSNFLKRGNCPECFPKTHLEFEFQKILNNIVPFESNKKVFYLTEEQNGNKALEADFYSQDHRLAIETNGLYWHSDKFHKYDYHLLKKKLADKNNIKLLQFFEDEITLQQDIVVSIIRAKLNLNQSKLGARKCELRVVEPELKKTFLIENHLQGNCNSFLNIGLFFKNELVCLLTFRKPSHTSKYGKNYCEIARFANKKNLKVSGGFQKMLKYAENLLKNNFTDILTYADMAYSDGNLYHRAGFTFQNTTPPQMWWVKKGVRYPRQISWGKSNEKMKSEGYSKIYGVGNLVFTKKIKHNNINNLV